MADALHVHEFGPADGPVVVMLHGVTGHGGRFRRLAAEQLPGHRVIAPDLRGHGRSPSLPPWTLEQHAADVAAVLETRGLGPVPVVAHSFGGVVALHLPPERVSSLLLLDPAVYVRPEDALANALSAGEAVADRAQALAAQRGDWPTASDDVIEEEVAAHWTQTERGWHPRYCPPAIATAWSEMCRPAPVPRVRAVMVRALGAAYVGAEYLRACEGADVEVVDVDCGHVVYLERPERVGELVAGLR
ncbi:MULTISPECIES: alpha/beta fold hydrolase [Actinokineospora]|uniref:Hydrolase, alpha/beta fold LipV n=1 Tax=Actinokineospora fastidiosa TaxID=1816 RepID=A0A918L6Q6_9PSEU|nr:MULTISPECIES: alpha/beta hydrolase [Actinokineospora]UVS77206.1 Haloalkane dehalogenase [Actinokineospora sp. UTMC 2448]GGS12761.1 putative hydrolase, alpha/beta fold LipV [Actinokineospora fastidiosa]